MKKHYRHETNCLNCGAELQGKFCHNCGQENLEIKESFGHMMNHAISDYFHFDHQFLHTLKPLLFQPGKLTNEYMAGKRAQFLHPVKMYIFISLVFFIFLFQDSHKDTKKPEPAKPKTEQTTKDSVINAVARNKNLSSAQKKKIEQGIQSPHITFGKIPPDTGKANLRNSIVTVDGIPRGDILNLSTTKDTSLEEYTSTQAKLDDKRDGLFRRLWNERAIHYHEEYGTRSTEVFIEEYRHNIPKMMFLLLPLFAFILMVTFYKSKKFYVEHLIYSFHLHCFLFLFFAILMVLQVIFPFKDSVWQWINLLAGFYVLWYICRSLRVVYQRSRFRTVTKVIGMSFTYFAAVIVCLLIVFFVTAIGGNVLGH